MPAQAPWGDGKQDCCRSPPCTDAVGQVMQSPSTSICPTVDAAQERPPPSSRTPPPPAARSISLSTIPSFAKLRLRQSRGPGGAKGGGSFPNATLKAQLCHLDEPLGISALRRALDLNRKNGLSVRTVS